MRAKKNSQRFFFENFWRFLTNVWTFAFLALVVMDFINPHAYAHVITPFSILYGAILSIFAGTKEFARWYVDRRDERHPGELYVIFWSFLILGLVLYSASAGNAYNISSDVVSAYIMVLTIFALTQASKRAHMSKKSKKGV